MIRFFRTIRRKLLAENSLNKYVLYATVEILLVVAGILIAVSIDNWNDDRKDRIVELKYLSNLKADLLTELENNDAFINYRLAKVKSSSSALNMVIPSSIVEVKEYTGYYETVFLWNAFVPNNNTFKELLSSGNLNLITNDAIKKGLLVLDNHYALIAHVEHHMRREFEEYLYDVNIQNTSALEFLNTKVIGDSLTWLEIKDIETHRHEKLIQDVQWLHSNQTFNNGLKLAFMNNSSLIKAHRELDEHLHFMIELINSEINK